MKQHKRYAFTGLFLSLLGFSLLTAADITISNVDPPMWWTGMENTELMLVVHGKNIAALEPVIHYPGVMLKTTTRSENPNYLFITLEIQDAVPGIMKIDFVDNKKVFLTYPYELKERRAGSAERGSFGSQDVVYLLMPDRFANGDSTNDSVDGLKEKVNRNNPDGRHGGDIQGIIDHLGYLQQLGITAVWTTPLLEDDMAGYSYHTYATTDFYKIDGRYGTNSDYGRLSEECHKKGIKLIMDLVPNHCGSDHPWMKDMPMKDWFHQFPQFTRTNYTIATLNDPHAAANDRALNIDGWFDTTMPDLDKHNPYVLAYLKQFAIFWVEYANLDGIRVDTYPYNEKWQIAEWTRAILEEYPDLNIMGECWQHNPAEIAYWQTGASNYDGYDSKLPTVMDFPLLDALGSAFNENVQYWDKGMSRFYNVYVIDYLYPNPDNLLVFLDNHDTQRFAENIAFDIRKYNLAVTHLLTTRGIPQIYYGTEIFMGGQKDRGDGDIRRDFPGGWPGDSRNAFSAEGRSEKENEAFNYISRLLNYRKVNPVLHSGKMVHFIPRDNVYVYFRINEEKTVMVVLNNTEVKVSLDTERFAAYLNGKSTGRDIITGQTIGISSLQLEPKAALVIELE